MFLLLFFLPEKEGRNADENDALLFFITNARDIMQRPGRGGGGGSGRGRNPGEEEEEEESARARAFLCCGALMSERIWKKTHHRKNEISLIKKNFKHARSFKGDGRVEEAAKNDGARRRRRCRRGLVRVVLVVVVLVVVVVGVDAVVARRRRYFRRYFRIACASEIESRRYETLSRGESSDESGGEEARRRRDE